jgi:oxygen-independent coproporphyrinogen-3 oxidase
MPKHLYIHIPFCKSICTYCDFKRFVCNKKDINEYTTKIISEINKKYKDCKFESIYIGGGTPNYLDDQTLSSLLSTLSKLQGKNCEFTIECNPEFVTQNQSAILKTHGVNRISLGVQTVNNKILSKYNRHHTKKDVIKAIKFLRANNIENISVDFMYGFNETSLSDLKKDIVFLKKYKIPHCSFYSLEIKSGSVLNKQNYKLDEDKVQEQLEYIVDHMPLNRYEVSS